MPFVFYLISPHRFDVFARAHGPLVTPSPFLNEREKLLELFRAARSIDGIGDCTGIEISEAIHASDQTRLYMGRIPETAQKLLIKVAIDPESGRPDLPYAREQFAALERIAARGLVVPQPFHIFSDDAVVVQSWVEGRSLDKLIADRATTVARLTALFREAGQWLGRFHAAVGVQFRELSLAHLTNEIEGGARAAGVGSNLLHEAAREIERARLRIAGHAQPVTRLHCDFKPSNLIVGDEGIVAIDFHESQPAAAHFDVAHFLNAMLLDALKGRRLTFLLRASALERAFLDGYEQTSRALDEPALRLFLVYDLAHYVLQSQGSGDTVKGLKSFVVGRLLARRVGALKRSLAAGLATPPTTG
jgi:tRNA A-37 threonylcarbamoyl transferase component Bud32